MKKKPSLNDAVDPKEAAKITAEYLATIIHMIRRQTEIAANAHIATGALLKAIGEQLPGVSESYEKHYAEDLKTSETAVQSRQIIAALDELFHQAKYGS